MMRARRGMTVLEVSVALVVAGTALAAGASVIGFLAEQQRRPGIERLGARYAAREQLRRWIEEAQLTTQGDAEFRSTGDPRASTRRDELIFVTRAPTPLASSGTIVRLFVSDSDTLPMRGLMAELRPWRRAGVPQLVLLAPEATGVEVRFLGTIFGHAAWQRSWVSTSVLPAAVEVRVVTDTTRATDEGDRGARALLSLPLTVAMGGRR